MTKVAAAVGLAMLLIVAGCGSDGPALTAPNVGRSVESAPRIHQGDTVTIGSMLGCLDKEGSVTITDISPVGGTGLEVTGWAVRPNPYWKPPPFGYRGPEGHIGVARATLARLEFPISREVDAECGEQGEGYELAVEVRKTTAGQAGATGWRVSYTSSGTAKSLVFPVAVRLCNEDKAWAKRCRALKV